MIIRETIDWYTDLLLEKGSGSVIEHKIASINISKALLNISLTTLAAIGSATSIPWLAGVTAVPGAIAASGTLRAFLERNEEEQLELPAPPSWTGNAQSWQAVCSNVEYRLPTILDTLATQLKHVQGIPTEALVKQLLLQTIEQELPAWEIPPQERGIVALYVTPPIFMKAAEVLKPILEQMQADTQAEVLVKIFDLLSGVQQTTGSSTVVPVASTTVLPTPVASSVTAILERKMQASAYDVYICYNEEDEVEVFAIGEELKACGVLPWFDFLEKPGKLRRKEQEYHIENIPAAAIFVGQHAIVNWQELQMYAFLNQFVERNCPVIPVLLKSAPYKPKLPPFLAMFVWVDFHQSAPDPIKQFIWGITDENFTLE
jgi:hypothetical protein